METKKEKIVSAVATIGIVLTLFGATYAYFASRVDAGKITDVEITANTVDVLTFETGDPITLNLDQENFASGKGNQSGSTFAKATLSANNKTNTATEHYYVYLYIEENTFIHTNEDGVPEILLRVTKNGTEITGGEYIDNFDYNGTNLIGYDITDLDGLIPIAYNEEITTTSTTEDVWNVEITFVNHDFDQSDNAGKSFKASLMIQKGLLLAQWVQGLYTGTQGENNIYYHNGTILDENGTVLDAEDNSYRFAGASDTTNNFVCFGSDSETCSNDNLYRIIGVFDNQVKLIKYDYATSEMLGTDGDYGGVYPAFGFLYEADSSVYTSYYQGDSSNLTNIAGYYWNKVNYDAAKTATGYYNDWRYSELNKTNLNKNYISYLDSIDTKWTDKIATMSWKVGGFSYDEFGNAKEIYKEEIAGSNIDIENITETAKIGLMYISDYGFAASPSAWTTELYYYNGNGASGNQIIDEDWMYMGLYEWTISRTNASYTAYGVGSMGFVAYDDAWSGYMSESYYVHIYGFAIRPVFYLNSDVKYVSGDGSKNSPIIIE